jgi:hypothetical protein
VLGEYVYRRCGEAWRVRFGAGTPFILLPSRGAAYLHRLLSSPNTPVSAADLAQSVAGAPNRVALGDAGEALDSEAISAFRSTYEDLEEQRREADRNNDTARSERVQHQLAALAEHLGRARGLGGRPRRQSSDKEKFRKAVGNAIRRVLADIAAEDPRLAEHLTPPRLSIGADCCYRPDAVINWDF